MDLGPRCGVAMVGEWMRSGGDDENLTAYVMDLATLLQGEEPYYTCDGRAGKKHQLPDDERMSDTRTNIVPMKNRKANPTLVFLAN